MIQIRDDVGTLENYASITEIVARYGPPCGLCFSSGGPTLLSSTEGGTLAQSYSTNAWSSRMMSGVAQVGCLVIDRGSAPPWKLGVVSARDGDSITTLTLALGSTNSADYSKFGIWMLNNEFALYDSPGSIRSLSTGMVTAKYSFQPELSQGQLLYDKNGALGMVVGSSNLGAITIIARNSIDTNVSATSRLNVATMLQPSQQTLGTDGIYKFIGPVINGQMIPRWIPDHGATGAYYLFGPGPLSDQIAAFKQILDYPHNYNFCNFQIHASGINSIIHFKGNYVSNDADQVVQIRGTGEMIQNIDGSTISRRYMRYLQFSSAGGIQAQMTVDPTAWTTNTPPVWDSSFINLSQFNVAEATGGISVSLGEYK